MGREQSYSEERGQSIVVSKKTPIELERGLWWLSKGEILLDVFSGQ